MVATTLVQKPGEGRKSYNNHNKSVILDFVEREIDGQPE
jgi:hypothetical protein